MDLDLAPLLRMTANFANRRKEDARFIYYSANQHGLDCVGIHYTQVAMLFL